MTQAIVIRGRYNGQQFVPSEPLPALPITSPEQLAETLRAFATEGIDHIQLWIDPNTIAGLEWVAPALAMARQM